MSTSSNINQYADIAAVLQTALPAGRATYTLPTEGKALHWMQRAYRYRKLLQKTLAETAPRGTSPTTPYDLMRLRRVGNAVHIDFNPAPEGNLTLASGERVKPQELAPLAAPPPAAARPLSASDPLVFAASELLSELGDDED